MAEKKYLDKAGVGHLYQKTREGMLTEEALEYINYLSDEEVPAQSFTVTSTKTELRAVTLADDGFEYGKAKRITVTISGSISGYYTSGIIRTPNKLTVNLLLPSNGRFFVGKEIEYIGNNRFQSGGTIVASFAEQTIQDGADFEMNNFSHTYTFYLAKVK